MGTFTTTFVRDCKPRDSMYELTCDALPGFILRVLPSGKKVFLVRYRVAGKDRRERIGPWGPSLSVQDARRRAALRLSGAPDAGPVDERGDARSGQRAAGKAARSEPRRCQTTVRELAERFVREYVDVYLKPRTAVNYRHLLAKVIVPALGDRDFESVTRADVQALHASLKKTPAKANYALCVTGSLFTRITDDWGLSNMRNPASRVKRFRERKRERFLTPEERRSLHEVMQAGLRVPPGRRGHLEQASVWALQLLALTGLRRDEIRTLKWPMVDWQHACLRLPDTKTGQRTVPVSSQVMSLLREIYDLTGSPKTGYVARSRTGGKLADLNHTWGKIREAVDLSDVRLHDLRHSFASDAIMSGVPLAVVGEMLGHRQPNTTKRYAHLADHVVRHALEVTTGRISDAVTQIPAFAEVVAPFEPLRDAQWSAIAKMVESTRGPGGLAADLRKVVDGIRWVLERNAKWREVPAPYAAPTTCWRWYERWCADGTWDRIVAVLGQPSTARQPARRRVREATVEHLPEAHLSASRRSDRRISAKSSPAGNRSS